ncbi:MAG: acyl-CoA synthetase FdrA [Ornithinibacter sp.]
MSATHDTTLGAKVFPRLYRDSVTLMAMAASVEKHDGIIRVGAVMATPANLEILERSGMRPPDLQAAPDDLVIVVRGVDDEVVTAGLEAAEQSLTTVEDTHGTRTEQAARTIAEGLAAAQRDGRDRPTMATISTPGTYAPIAVEQALKAGLHVFCFSDNVALEDEVRLKALAVDNSLLMMGPDCGTAIIDGVPLGFANVVTPGPVGIVAASGTGAQEISTLLDRAGSGVSQLIGVGGRDLSAEVGGVMTDLGLTILAKDEATQVVVVVSKPPCSVVASGLLARMADLGKPAVACLLGVADSDDGPVAVRGTLEGGAQAAARLAGHPLDVGASPTLPPAPGAPGVLGLYTGGTLAAETSIILRREGVQAQVLDLGDDEYTTGRPHPMIDPAARADRVAEVGSQSHIGILLVDLVLGHGASADPATPLADAVRTARSAAEQDGRELVVLASVCGTAADPQGFDAQRAILESAGVLVHPSNAAAARSAIELVGNRASTNHEENA